MNADRTDHYRTIAAVFALALAATAAPLGAQVAERTTGTVLREGVPETYVVKRGDTLWDISAMFLRDPWLWPDIWQVNPEIPNPHLIYPGDIIRLIWVDGRPQLVVDRTSVERLSPEVREGPLDDPIPMIPLEAIRPFLERPTVVGKKELNDAPYLLRSVDGRLMSAQGTRVYARGFEEDAPIEWTVVRKGQEYRDPDTRKVIGYEATYIADAVMDRVGDPATLLITASRQEAMSGDRLVPDAHVLSDALYPHAPSADVEGRMIAIVGEGLSVSQYTVVVINRGREDGVEPGTVLSIWRAGEKMKDPHSGGWFSRSVQLPDERAGELIVFRAPDELAFALVMRSTRDMAIGDLVRNP